MIDTDKYEGHQPAPWRWVKPTGEWFLYAEQGNYSDLNHQGAGGIWLPDTFCRLGKGLDPTHREGEATYNLIADAPLLLEEVKRLRKALYWVAVEETRDDVDYMWEGVDEILSGHPRWAQTKCIQTGEEWDYTKRDWTRSE